MFLHIKRAHILLKSSICAFMLPFGQFRQCFYFLPLLRHILFGFSAIKRAVQPRRAAINPPKRVVLYNRTLPYNRAAPFKPAVPYNRTVCFYGKLFVSVFAFKSELCIQNTLSKAQALRSDLQKLIIGKKLYARLKTEFYRRYKL